MEEQFYAIALMLVPGIGLAGKRHLLNEAGSAKKLFESRRELQEQIPSLPHRILDLLDCPSALRRAEEEMAFIEKHHIRCLTFNDEDYPSRLRECDDAPIVLYYKGNADLNAIRVVAMVGTRKATTYGQDICSRFYQELKESVPEVLVVSGLAYGIDICSHRAALRNGFDTVGVLAHGLDRLYPSQHRNTAMQMVEHGGLLTEFMTQTNPDRQNFIMRNRIVAGMSDAIVVVESAVKGGALVTADIANSYQRECFAFPGRIGDEYSIGCNNLIQQNKAALITSAADFVEAMGWGDQRQKPKTVQRELFVDLTEEEQLVVDKLKGSPSGMQINTLVVETNLPVNKMSALLFELEMRGVVQSMAGGIYRLLN
ncbi:MAG: DNA-processing protein DprA [Phocaeicola sp.]|nr:DNA-processing protein DprA [Phocaeicola sp.]